MLYNQDGDIRVTVVNGNSLVGIQAADGSLNAVLNDGNSSTGLHHRSGAFNAIEVTDTPSSVQAPNGSCYIFNTTDGYVLYNPNKVVSSTPPDPVTNYTGTYISQGIY